MTLGATIVLTATTSNAFDLDKQPSTLTDQSFCLSILNSLSYDHGRDAPYDRSRRQLSEGWFNYYLLGQSRYDLGFPLRDQ